MLGPMLARRRPIAAVAAVAVLGLAACGNDEPSGSDQPAGEQSAAQTPPTAQERLAHIHGLGVDPSTKTLYVATHYGLFEAAKGSEKLRQVGDSTQDIMGFSVVSADRFVGSGHPDPSQNLPPNLGLIESRDGGRTWKNISLLGEADFHVLRSAGERVYGFDGTQGRLMVSSNGGRSWQQRTPPAAVFDLAVDPRDPDSIVVSTERGVFASTNAGKGWRQVRDDLAGLMAWPAADTLFLVDEQGQVLRSDDGGKGFAPVGELGGQPVALASHKGELYAALGDGTVKRSSDSGASWSVRAAP